MALASPARNVDWRETGADEMLKKNGFTAGLAKQIQEIIRDYADQPGQAGQQVTDTAIGDGTSTEAGGNLQNKTHNDEMFAAVKDARISFAKVHRLIAALKNGANVRDVDAKGQTAIMYAALNHLHLEFGILLTYNADLRARDHKGRTVVHFAAMSGNLAMLRVMISVGCNLQEKDSLNRLPAHWAAASGQKETLLYLINMNPACVLVPDESSFTVFQWCLQPLYADDLEFFKTLIKLITDAPDGAALLKKLTLTADDRGCTSLYWAARECELNVVHFLLSSSFSMQVSRELYPKQAGPVTTKLPVISAFGWGKELNFFYLLAKSAAILRQNKSGLLHNAALMAIRAKPNEFGVSEFMNKYLTQALETGFTDADYEQIKLYDLAFGRERSFLLPADMRRTSNITEKVALFIYTKKLTFSEGIRKMFDADSSDPNSIKQLELPPQPACNCELMQSACDLISDNPNANYAGANGKAGFDCVCGINVARYFRTVTFEKGERRSQALRPVHGFSHPVLIMPCSPRCACDSSSCNCMLAIVQSGANVYLEVFCHKNTPDQRLGVRTREHINTGEFVALVIGEVVTHEEATKLQREYLRSIPMPYYIEAPATNGQLHPCLKLYVNQAERANWTRLLAHSCEPNLSVHLSMPKGETNLARRRISLFSNRPISRGEELTMDFGLEYWMWKMETMNAFCDCGAGLCKWKKMAV